MIKVVEGLLFISGYKGITIAEVMAITNLSEKEIISLIAQIKTNYVLNDNAFTIIESAGSYKMTTTNENTAYYQKYVDMEYNEKLSSSALETLTIIAYNQPVTRFDIEEKRGVQASHNLKVLMSRDLVKIIGKSEELGKPNLYGTTIEFLDYLGINNISDLPPLKEYNISVSTGESDMFDNMQDFKEIRKRLLSDDNMIEFIEEPEFEDIDDIIINPVESQLVTEDDFLVEEKEI